MYSIIVIMEHFSITTFNKILHDNKDANLFMLQVIYYTWFHSRLFKLGTCLITALNVLYLITKDHKFIHFLFMALQNNWW